MEILIKSAKPEWEGTTYAAIHGDIDIFRKSGFGQVENNFKDSFIILKNEKKLAEGGCIIRGLVPDRENFIEIDPQLLSDLSISTGDMIEICPLKPVPASQIRIAVSKSDFNQHEVKNSCKTYLLRHPVSKGQKKPIYFLTGERIIIEILEVNPCESPIFSNTTEIIIDNEKTACSLISFDEVGGLESEKKTIRERILLPVIQPDFFSSHGIRPPRGILLC